MTKIILSLYFIVTQAINPLITSNMHNLSTGFDSKIYFALTKFI